MTPADSSYLQFLERQFSEEALEKTEPSAADQRSSACISSDDERWARAATSITPRSQLGALFGTTKTDIQKAARLLAGTPEFGLLPRVVRRTIDAIIASVLLLLLGPPMLTIALAIKAEDGGPILQAHVRVGAHGRRFRLWKYRTVRVDETPVRATLADGPGPNGVLFKLGGPSRITRVGHFLRRTSLDELPQLWNILKGDMSFVGPRAPLPQEVALYDSYQGRRLLIKPGMTGLSQLSQEASRSWDQLIALDVEYVETWSLWLDLTILVKTIRELLRHPTT